MDSIPITRDMAIEACRSMKEFHAQLIDLYNKHDMDLAANRGRRNVLMSAPMEHFLAKSIKDSGNFYSVRADGRTGEADITIYTESGRPLEIECKLTSPQQSSGSITFQTDHDTLKNKGSLDYVYIIANENFDSFCFLYFKGLTIDDFRSLSPGARGKVQMYKWSGMKKATVLVGEAISSNDTKIDKITNTLKEKVEQKAFQLGNWKEELKTVASESKKNSLSQKIINGLDYIDNAVNKVANDVRIITQSNARYSFKYESV